MSHAATIMEVILLIWVGLFLYLVRIEGRLKRLERRARDVSKPSEPNDTHQT